MKRNLLMVVAASLALGAAPSAPSGQSHFILNVSGFYSASFSGTGPESYAERRAAVGGKPGERLAIKLRGATHFGKLDFDATPDVTGKSPLNEAGRYDIGNLGAIGSVTLDKQKNWVNARTGELVIEESDGRHVKGHLDFKGPCRTGPEQGLCTVHAEFDVTRRH
jgi:hypothetical protein